MRNSTLDLYKFFSCFLVIFIHSGVSCWGHDYFLTIARIAVPIFYMITGFYYSSIIKRKKERTFIKKILTLTVFSTLLYSIFVYKMLPGLLGSSLVNWLCFNAIPFGEHLWYLYSLIYVLVIAHALHLEQKGGRVLLIISVLLIFVNFILTFQSNSIYYRNYLFTGLPYFLLGMFISKNLSCIRNISISVYKQYLILLVFFLLLLLELYSYKINNIYPQREHYIIIYPLCFCLFCFAIRHPHINEGKLLSFLGQKYSSDIYIYHGIVILVVNRMFAYFEHLGYISSVSHNFLFPFLILLLSISAIYLYRKTVILLKSFLLNNRF